MVKLFAAVLLVAGAAGACTLFDDPPKNTCKTDPDCFRAQGEVCDMQKHVCVKRTVDAGVDAP